MSSIPAKGTPAPDFSTLTDTGAEIRLSDLKGQKIVLYFYPKADTSGCTKQACAFRDQYDVYEANGITVLGVSPDTVEEQAKFKAKFQLPFTLLADHENVISELYGMYGKQEVNLIIRKFTYNGVQRSTFIIDEDGIIQHVMLNVDPTANASDVLQALEINEAN